MASPRFSPRSPLSEARAPPSPSRNPSPKHGITSPPSSTPGSHQQSADITGVKQTTESQNVQESKEQEDQRERSIKKLNDHPNYKETSGCTGETVRPRISYRDLFLGSNGSNFNQVEMDLDEETRKEMYKPFVPTEDFKKLMEIYPVVELSDEEWMKLCKPWEKAMIVTLLGRNINIRTLRQRLITLWGIQKLHIVDLENNYFAIRFEKDQDYSYVLEGGPWVVLGHYLVIQTWTPDFDPANNVLTKVAVWIRITNLPLPLYDKDTLKKIGSKLGKVLKIDENTFLQMERGDDQVERGKFARLSIEIDLRKQLIPQVIVRNYVFNIEYEGLNLICFDCGCQGYRKEDCPLNPGKSGIDGKQNGELEAVTDIQNTTMETLDAKKLAQTTDPFGPWMIARRKTRGRGRATEERQIQNNNDYSISGSRFQTLSELNPDSKLMERQEEY